MISILSIITTKNLERERRIGWRKDEGRRSEKMWGVRRNFMTCVFNQFRMIFTFSSNFLYLLSFSSVCFAANSIEREIWELFGVCFNGHHHLSRMFTDWSTSTFPLNKLFVLFGISNLLFCTLTNECVINMLWNGTNTLNVFRVTSI